MTQLKIDYEVKLTKLSDNENDLRDNEIIGVADSLPEEGQPFIMTAPPRDINIGMRFINTSIVDRIDNKSENIIEFKTMNSLYRIDILKRLDDD